MRNRLDLKNRWWVSTSKHDARRSAQPGPLKIEELELAHDPENHPRQISLPGGWQYGLRPLEGAHGEKPHSDQTPTPTEAGNAGSSTPTKRLPSHFLTYAQRVKIPPAWRNHSVLLHLNNARYHVTAEINGVQVTHYVGGLEPHRVDVTEAIRPGEENEIVITVGDVGVSGHRPFDPHRFTGTRLPTCKEIENNLVHPVHYGGIDGRAVDEVRLEAAPPIRVEYVFAKPSVSSGTLHYTVALSNDTNRETTVRLRSIARPSRFNQPGLIKAGNLPSPKRLLDRDVVLPAKTTIQVKEEIPWPDARWWDTDDPFLYDLCTTLTERSPSVPPANSHIASRRLDLHRDTFGFREFTINGHDFLLNGRKIHLFGQSGHIGPKQHAMSLEEKIEFFRIAKVEGHINHVRLHARPMPKDWVIAADRAGMLITTETALWTTGFHSFDWAGSEDACYENVRNHFFEALVRRDRNNPSVVIWSLSNEMSPITPWDLTEDKNAAKMAAMTRVFKRILAEAAAEDDSRVIQMSSAMDFLGHLAMYNLHYPKNWQAFPDYPHTAYWLDHPFKFPWYGVGYSHMPSWVWRKDKPLYFGEYTCVFGATPDNQASIIGDVAFEEADFGTAKVQEKLWGMEAQAYRRQDVSGFCAWSFLLGNETDCRKLLAQPEAAVYVRAIRPLAVLDHNYRTECLADEEIAFPLSMHNDTRQETNLELVCEARINGASLTLHRMPRRTMKPGESVAFENRFLAPNVSEPTPLLYRVTLLQDGTVVDYWEKTITVHPRSCGIALPDDFGLFDPNRQWSLRLDRRGIQCPGLISDLSEESLAPLRALWIGFDADGANAGDWRRLRRALDSFVKEGGCLILDRPPLCVLADLPIPLSNGKGYAPENRLEITFAYAVAPFHPVLKGFQNKDFALWGESYYVARRCLDIPQEGNVIPLLAAGTDRAGLTCTPLLEMRYGKGSILVSTLEVVPAFEQSPIPAQLLASLATYRPAWNDRSVGVCLQDDAWQRVLEVGWLGNNEAWEKALEAEIALLDGRCIDESNTAPLAETLHNGRTVCLHALNVTQTRQLLQTLHLPGEVLPGTAKPGEWDVFRHTHPLTNGMTNNYLYWIVQKAKSAPWSLASLHPEPASALIRLPPQTENAASLTRRGALTVYRVGPGTLVLDNLRWHLTDLDEPERARRFIRCLLTNLGVPLLRGIAKRMSEEFETEAERRERGHF